MEALKQARNLYVKMHSCGSSLSEEDKSRLKRDIQRFIVIAVKEIPLRNIFVNPCMLSVLNVALNNRASHNSTDLVPVVKAFEYLERYMLLLLEQPWKDEFKKLKMYGGFYRTRIKSALQVPEDIFRTAGYQATKDDTLIHTGHVDKNSLLLLAFDCKIASVQGRTVADTYCMEKNIGKSLSTVISDRLGSNLAGEQNKILLDDVHKTTEQSLDKMRETSKIQIPPALPRRDPIAPQSQARQRVSYESAHATGCESGHDVFGVQNKGNGAVNRFAHPEKYGSSSLGPRSPLLSSNVIRSNFSYNDDEKIPELPQGTIDEHMRESVKFLSQDRPAASVGYIIQKQRSKSNDWDSLGGSQIIGNRTVPMTGVPLHVTQLNASHQLSVNTYPPGSLRYTAGRPTNTYTNDVSISSDEGIGSSNRFMQNSLHASYSQVTSPAHEISSSHQDLGMKQRGHPPLLNSYSAPIYIPPSLDESDGIVPCMSAKQIRAPPPIPSRALKPVLPDKPINSNNIKGSIYSTSSGVQTVVEHHKSPLSPPGNVTAPGQIDSRTAILPQSSQTEPILRRDRYRVGGKSSSLKYGDERSAAVHEIANRPLARSMDITLTQWQCGSCSSINMASDLVCSVCAHSRQGPDTGGLIQGSRKKKACPACTLENDVDLTHCSCCSSKLDECFTYT